MQTSIKGIPSNTFINTVILSHNRANPDNVYLFRCYKCGTAINQIRGLIWSITAGYTPSTEVATINECHQCKEKYTFQSFTGASSRLETNLILSVNPPLTTFHCVFCRQPLVQYTPKVAALLPEFIKIKLGSSFQCFTPTCKSGYYLNDIVEPEMI